ncbi:hypothetical protein ACTXT7_017609 [Hymenolepis weldensis]
MSARRLINKLKRPEELECLWFFSYEKHFHQDQESIEEVIGGYVRANPTEVPTVIRTKFLPTSLRVNADAEVYVETLQTIVVKPPWIDSVANGGRPYIFQHASALSHKALNTQDWMDGREFSSSCHTKLPMAAS